MTPRWVGVPTYGQSTLAAVAPPVTGMTPAPGPPPGPPGRALVRLAGVLSQLTGAVCLLVGTIGLVLVQQTKAGSVGAAVAWLIGAMACLIAGGLVYRGGLVRLIVAALIDAAFGVILLVIDVDTLRALLKILPASDVDTIAQALRGAAIAMLGAGATCLIAIPQGIRFARWFANAAAASVSAMSTARGFPPPPVPVRNTLMMMPDEEPASRRRLYMVLGGLAIGVGAGVGVLVSSTSKPPDDPPHDNPVAQVQAPKPTTDHHMPDAGTIVMKQSDAGVTVSPPVVPDQTIDDPQSLVAAEHAAIAKVDKITFQHLLAPNAFGFGVDGDELGENRDAVIAQIARDLGEPPPDGFTIDTNGLQIGKEKNHAWIAEDLEISAAGQTARRFLLSSLAIAQNGKWVIVATHWARPVSDPVAERLAILGTLPVPKPVADHHEGDDTLDKAVRAAFASKTAFADAFTDRTDGFNFGSGGERAKGGSGIKRVFGKLHAQIRMHDGARVIAGGVWDPGQQSVPWIGWAALDVDFTSKSRAATDVTQTFRVLAVLVKDAGGWKIVQTHWSNAGPISDR